MQICKCTKGNTVADYTKIDIIAICAKGKYIGKHPKGRYIDKYTKTDPCKDKCYDSTENCKGELQIENYKKKLQKRAMNGEEY